MLGTKGLNSLGTFLRKETLGNGLLFRKIVLYFFLVNIAFVILYPLIYMVSTSLMSIEDYDDPSINWLPIHIQFENYSFAFQRIRYLQALSNSLFITIPSLIGQIVSCSLIGYGFARVKFPGRDIFFILVILTMIVPPQTVILPLFILYVELKWINTYWPFIVPSFFGFGLRGAIFIFIFRQAFKTLPWELEDAARIDGAGALSTYWRIMLPLIKPATVTAALFSFVWHWNDFYEPLMYLNSNQKYTLALMLAFLREVYFRGRIVSAPIFTMAAGSLVIAPSLLLYFFTQRYFVESIERTGLTG